jgi:toxin ParE1/3/4
MPHRLAPQARRDLDEIWHYLVIETGNESTADQTIDLIVHRFQLLSKWPRLGRARDDLRRGLRSFVVGNYVIFFMVSFVPM